MSVKRNVTVPVGRCAACTATNHLQRAAAVSQPRPGPEALSDCGDDLCGETWERREEVRALRLQALDLRAVLVRSARALVELPRLQHLDVVDSRHRRRDEIAEVRIALPLDRPVRDALDDRRRMLDAHLL